MNLMFLLMHFALYGGASNTLLKLHNPFADLIVVLAFTSLIGLWLCFDYMLPVLCEAVRRKDRRVQRPIFWMMFFSVAAMTAGSLQILG